MPIPTINKILKQDNIIPVVITLLNQYFVYTKKKKIKKKIYLLPSISKDFTICL